MIKNKKITVVLPAYNASKTLITTFNEIPFDVVDEVILVDDNSSDETASVCRNLLAEDKFQKGFTYFFKKNVVHNTISLRRAWYINEN